MRMLKCARNIVHLIVLILLFCQIDGCKGKIEEMPLPAAPKEAYMVTDSFETIYQAMTDPKHDEIARYNIWAAYRNKKIKWAAELFSAQVKGQDVQATFAFLYDRDKGKFIAGVEALFKGEEGAKLLKEAAPGRKIIFEGFLTSYSYKKDGTFIVNVASAKTVNE